MRCSVCRKELEKGEMLRLETSEEHICNPNGEISMKQSWQCSDKDCYARLMGVVWNDDGDYYGKSKLLKEMFVDNLPEAFGSFSRQLAVEIHKHDEDFKLLTFPCWPRKGWTLHVSYSYKSNENGDILKRKRHYSWNKADGALYISGLRMLKFGYKRYRQTKLRLSHDPYDKDARNELEFTIERETWKHAEWWRKVEGWLARRLLKKLPPLTSKGSDGKLSSS